MPRQYGSYSPNQRFDGLPRALVGYGQDLPIVGVHAKLVAAAHPTQQAGVLLFPRLRLVDDDFQQKIMSGAPRPREEAAQLALVLFHDLGRILRTGAGTGISPHGSQATPEASNPRRPCPRT